MKYIDEHGARFVDELIEWVKIPAISDAPEHARDVVRSAEHLASSLRALAPAQLEILPTPGHPAVFAAWNGGGPSAPTLLVYGHHDVQPVDPLAEWITPPFEPQIREGKLYGRGTVDDKGQVLIHVKAIESFLKSQDGGALPINVKLIIKGEEEVGSPNLDGLLREHAARLACDYVCVSDTAMYGRGIPSLCIGLRGLAYFDLVVRGPTSDVHSGSFGGGIANPANALARILANLHDDDGRVMIPDSTIAFATSHRESDARIAALPHDDAEWLELSGAPASVGERGYSTLERIWARPTLDICGLTSGFQAAGSKTIIPAVASAKVSCRLVPDQTPDEIGRLFESYVRRVAPLGVTVDVTALPGGLPYLAPSDHPVFASAERAFSRAFGKPTVFIREGGSIPFVRTIADITGKPCLLMGFGQPDENAHAPNEWLLLENFHLGIKSAAYLYDELARLDG